MDCVSPDCERINYLRSCLVVYEEAAEALRKTDKLKDCPQEHLPRDPSLADADFCDLSSYFVNSQHALHPPSMCHVYELGFRAVVSTCENPDGKTDKIIEITATSDTTAPKLKIGEYLVVAYNLNHTDSKPKTKYFRVEEQQGQTFKLRATTTEKLHKSLGKEKDVTVYFKTQMCEAVYKLIMFRNGKLAHITRSRSHVKVTNEELERLFSDAEHMMKALDVSDEFKQRLEALKTKMFTEADEMRIDKMVNKMNVKMEHMREWMDEKMEQTDGRMDQTEDRVDQIEERMKLVERRIGMSDQDDVEKFEEHQYIKCWKENRLNLEGRFSNPASVRALSRTAVSKSIIDKATFTEGGDNSKAYGKVDRAEKLIDYVQSKASNDPAVFEDFVGSLEGEFFKHTRNTLRKRLSEVRKANKPGYNAEAEVLLSSTDTLTEIVANNLSNISGNLRAKSVITPEQHNTIMIPNQEHSDQNLKIIFNQIESEIKKDPEKLMDFIEMLENMGTYYKKVCDSLRRNLKMV